MPKVLDLFSGIGGFSLGLNSAGFETAAFCELEEFPRKILQMHWPRIPIHRDIRTLNGFEHRGKIDVICGGFPCQDISAARGGNAKGITGTKSGLWKEMHRIIGECRPSIAIIENSARLTSRGLEHILYDLSSIGFDACWHCVPASAVGAPHERDRIWIIAYASCFATYDELWAEKLSQEMAKNLADANSHMHEKTHALWEWSLVTGGHYWNENEPDLRRVDDGISNWSHRIKALGNAVVPQVPELIGRSIIKSGLLNGTI